MQNDFKTPYLNNQNEDELIKKTWIEINSLISWFCNNTTYGNKIIEQIWFLEDIDKEIIELNNIFNYLIKRPDFGNVYSIYQNIFISLLTIYYNFHNYLVSLNDKLNETIGYNSNDDNISELMINLKKLDIKILQVAKCSNFLIESNIEKNKLYFEYKYFYPSINEDLIKKTNIKRDNITHLDFLEITKETENNLNNKDVAKSINCLFGMFRCIESMFDKDPIFLNSEYSNIMRKFIHVIIRHDGYINETQNIKFRQKFLELDLDSQITMLTDIKDFIVIAMISINRKYPDYVYNCFKNIQDNLNLTLNGYLEIYIDEKNESKTNLNTIEINSNDNNSYSIITKNGNKLFNLENTNYFETSKLKILSKSQNNGNNIIIEKQKNDNNNFGNIKLENESIELNDIDITNASGKNSLLNEIEIEPNKQIDNTNLETEKIEIIFGELNNKEVDFEIIENENNINKNVDADIQIKTSSTSKPITKKTKKTKKTKAHEVEKIIVAPTQRFNFYNSVESKMFLSDLGIKKINNYDLDFFECKIERNDISNDLINSLNESDVSEFLQDNYFKNYELSDD